MKDLREYIREGIFDTSADSIEGNEDYEKIVLTDIVLELLNGNNNRWDFTRESIMKAIDDHAIDLYSHINGSNRRLHISHSSRGNYNLPSIFEVGKHEIDVLKKYNINSLQHSYGGNGCIRLLDELDGVDCGGIQLISNHIAVMPSFKLVNLKLCIFTNTKGMTFFDNEFKNVSIQVDSYKHEQTGYSEFDGKRIPKLCFIQYGNPSKNIFDDINLDIASNHNLSIGSTAAGKMIGDLVDEMDKEHGSSDWKANPLSSAEKSKIRNSIRKILNTKDISHISGIAYEYMNINESIKGGCKILEMKDFYHHDGSYDRSNSYDYEYAIKRRTPVFMYFHDYM